MHYVIAFDTAICKIVSDVSLAADMSSPYPRALNAIGQAVAAGEIDEDSHEAALEAIMDGTIEQTEWNKYVEYERQNPSVEQ